MTDLFEAEATTTTTLDLRRLQRQERRATRRKWTMVISAVALVLFSIGASTAWNFVEGAFAKDETVIADYDGPGQGTIQVVVEPGDTGSDIAKTLFSAGVVASEEAFIIAARNNPDSASIKPGYYFLAREMKAEYALQFLLDPERREVRKITIPEGKTVEFYYQKIADLTEFSLDEVRDAAADTTALGLPAEANGNIEGWLFPSTYQFNPGVTPTDVLSAMVAQTVKVLESNGVARSDWLRILTIASLIEREARLDEDRPLISGVVANRLERNMPLQFDSTVKYLSPTEGVFTTAEERQIDSLYNTYKYPGLPPGPIAAPGEKSIQAAINPSVHSYVYFVTVDLWTGETLYAETLPEHNRNVAVLQRWYAENGG